MSALVYIDGKIIACPENTLGPMICWSYNITENNWRYITSLNYVHYDAPGVAFDNKIYFVDDEHPEVYDPRNNSLSTWPAPENKIGMGPCLIVYGDTILAIGGNSNSRGVQSFNTSLNLWTVRDAGNAPYDMTFHSCILEPGVNFINI